MNCLWGLYTIQCYSHFLDFMRFSSFAVASLFGNGLAASTDCFHDISDSTWYTFIVSAARNNAWVAFASQAALITRINAIGGLSASLSAHLTNNDTCGAVLFSFANGFFSLTAAQQILCSQGNESSAGCLSVLSTYINTVNNSPTMLGRNFVTGAAITDCSDIPAGSSWYSTIVSRVIAGSGSSYATATDLSTAISQTPAALGTHLVNGDICGTLLFVFANQVAGLYASVNTSCNLTNETNDACLTVLYDAIIAVNTSTTMAGKDIVTGVARITICSDVPANSSWYTKLVSHVVSNGPTQYNTGAELKAALSAPPLTLSFHLSYGDSCGSLLLAFRNTVAGLHASAITSCIVGSEASAACLVLLYDAINTVHSYSTTMLGKNIVTGLISVRCSTTSWVTFMLAHNPWEDMLAGSLARTAYASLSMDTTNLACASCLSALYAVLPFDAAGPCFGTDAAFSDACRAALITPLSTFAACTGGHYMNTYGCTQLTDAVFDYHPYQAYVACAQSASVSVFTACLGTAMSRTIAPTAYTCKPCYTTFSSAIRSKDIAACNTNKYTSNCIAVFDTQPTTGTFGSPLKEFEICTKKTVDRTAKTCALATWSLLLPKYKFFATIYASVISMGNAVAAGTMIADVESFNDMETAITALVCKSCFNIFAADVFTRWQSWTTPVCFDPTSSGCATALLIPLNAFTYCSGQVLSSGPPPPDDCSDIPGNATWYSALVGAGIAATESYIESTLSSRIRAAGGPSVIADHLSASDACGTAVLTFANAVFALKTSVSTSCTSPNQASLTCLVHLSEAINVLNAETAMDGRDIVTGLTSYRCTSDEWTALTYEFRSVVPIYVAIKHVADSSAALAVFHVDANLADFAAAVAGIACETCFDNLASDLYTQYTTVPAVGSACANPYTSACETALATSLTAFGVCSGHVLNRGPTSTTCTDAEFAAFIDFGVAESIVAAAIDSTSAEAFTHAITALLASLTEENLEAPCWSCFTDLAYTVFNLNEMDLAICEDIESSECLDIIGDYITGFQDCSGSAFALKTSTTTVAPTTTLAASTTTTAASTITTAARTTTAADTTTAATTTKSSMLTVTSAGLVFILIDTL